MSYTKFDESDQAVVPVHGGEETMLGNAHKSELMADHLMCPNVTIHRSPSVIYPELVSYVMGLLYSYFGSLGLVCPKSIRSNKYSYGGQFIACIKEIERKI